MAVILSLDEYERLVRKAGEWPEDEPARPSQAGAGAGAAGTGAGA
jgi:hypothetical protein